MIGDASSQLSNYKLQLRPAFSGTQLSSKLFVSDLLWSSPLHSHAVTRVSMLKRQRQNSPLPWGAESTDFAPAADFVQTAKRRRILAPPLDGRLRGVPRDEDEWPTESEDEVEDSGVEQVDGWEGATELYKDANVLLHQVHIEQQRRMHKASLPHVAHEGSSNSAPSPSTSSLPISKSASWSSHHPSHPLDYLGQSGVDNYSSSQEIDNVRARYEESNR